LFGRRWLARSPLAAGRADSSMGSRVRTGSGLTPLPVPARRGDSGAMAEVLIIYGTSEGHTAVVVDHLRRPLETAGHLVRACSVDDAPTCPIGYDLVLVGSSIHQGHHNRAVTRWAKGNAELLTRMPSAFFQVCLASAGDRAGAVEAERYVDDLVRATGWRPDAVGLFGGALLYTHYGLVKRTMLKSIAGSAGLDTDVHRDFDYTDYEAVEQFAQEVAALLDRVPHAASA
jgi:menaquinone-dependent protoporphyrinogen oxidase